MFFQGLVQLHQRNTAPSVSDVFGNWEGTALNGSAALVSISRAGGITGSNGGCTFRGSAVPRSSGKNVFNINITFDSNCIHPGQSASGLAFSYPLGNGKRQLVAAVKDGSKAYGYLFLAQRLVFSQ